MSTKPPKPPNNVPEEDLSLHEDFAPIIAENGLIRQPKAPEVREESLPAFLTQLDTLQDLVQLRQAEQAEQQKQQTEQHPEMEKPKPQAATEKPILDLEENTLSEKPAQTALVLTSTHLPTVRAAQTTALIPVSKLTLARRLKLLKRKRQHKRRLAARARLRAAQAAQTAVPPKMPRQKSASAQNPAPKRPSRWKWAFVLLLLLFLGGISGLVPVEKIPGLRNLAYAMGFTKDDTARMSFLRALLTWTDKTIGLPGNWSGEGANASLLAQVRGEASDSAGAGSDGVALPGLNSMSRGGGKTSLIDMQALNALQRQKGYALDGVRGAVKLTPGQEEADLGPAVVRDDKVNVRTEANRDKGEVFFGSDTSAVNRNFKDGYDSSKTLAKVKNPHIADGKPIDWLLNTTQRTLKAEGGLGGLNKQLDGTKVGWGDSIVDVGEKKEHKDLYHAWITSRMSKYTPNVMLKKGLADSSFLGAAIPTMASNVLSFTGIQVDLGAMQEDESAWKEYLEWEKNCREELMGQNGGGKMVEGAINTFNDLFPEDPIGAKTSKRAKGYNLDFPKNCEEAEAGGAGYISNLDVISSSCKKAQEGYRKLRDVCHMVIPEPHDNPGQCNKEKIEHLKGFVSPFAEECKACDTKTEKNEQGEDVPVNPEECRKEVTANWQGVVAGIEKTVLKEIGGKTDYFPQIVYKDEEGEIVGAERAQESVYKGMEQNKTL